MSLTRPKAHQLDNVISKNTCRLVSVTNLPIMSAVGSIDGVLPTSGDYILLVSQTNPVENGIYVVTSINDQLMLVRSVSFDNGKEIYPGLLIYVTEGVSYSDTEWRVMNNDNIVIGTTEIIIERWLVVNSIGQIDVVGSNTIASTEPSGTVKLVPGNNITISSDVANSSITINAADHPPINLGDIQPGAAAMGQVATFDGKSWTPLFPALPTPAQIGTLKTEEILPYISTVTNDANGFPDRIDTSISFNDATRTFTLTPLNQTACVYVFGVKYVISSALSLQISNVNGGRYISFDPQTQQLYEAGQFPNFRTGNPTVAYIGWSVEQQKAFIIGEERHGSDRDTHWHYTNHRDVGMVWRQGGGIGYTANSESDLSIAISTPLVVADEDLEHTIVNSAEGGYFQQILDPIANLPVLHYVGTAYQETAPSGTPWLYSLNGRAQYNLISNGVGSLAEAPDNTYINYWVATFHSIRNPVKLLLGRQAHSTLEAAQDETFEALGLYMPEKVSMYRVTIHTSNAYTNAGKLVIADVAITVKDITGTAQAQSAVSHDTLLGKTMADQHPIGSITGLDAELNNKAPVVHTHSLADLVQSGATLNQLPQWNGVAWTPASVANKLLQTIHGTIPALSTTARIPWDNTTPSAAEGAEIWSVTITPTSLTSAIVISSSTNYGHSNSARFVSFVLFRNSVAVTAKVGYNTTTTMTDELSLLYIDTTPRTTLDPITYSMRVGGSGTGTTYISQNSAGVRLNGLLDGQYIIQEIEL